MELEKKRKRSSFRVEHGDRRQEEQNALFSVLLFVVCGSWFVVRGCRVLAEKERLTLIY